MSNIAIFSAVIVGAACTLFWRTLPFLLLGGRKKIPEKIQYLGRMLPPALMAVLIVYCLKDVPDTITDTGVSKLIAVVVCAGLHVWKKNFLLSIVVSTALYMMLCSIF